MCNLSFIVSSTFVCPTEIIAFSERIKDFKDVNTEVVGGTFLYYNSKVWSIYLFIPQSTVLYDCMMIIICRLLYIMF